MSRIVHFELPTSDAGTSRKFYENVFGWKFTQYGGPVDYWLVTTGDAGAPGIDGGLGGAANELKATVNTVGVDNLDETLRMVLANGGQIIMPKDEIPGMGYLAYFREPGGAVLGAFQAIPGSMD
jgi:uncharacterized protein